MGADRLTSPALADAGRLPDAEGDAPRRPRLLVVDDQSANIQILYQVFGGDHQVIMATSGERALELCAQDPPDLVLLDVVMPGMDGYEVCARLKADAALRDIPVVFITGYGDEAAEMRGLHAGAVDFISKPINPVIVRARVQTQLRLKIQSDLLRQWVYIDGLTGVYNRRGLDERLRSDWGRAVRTHTPLSAVMVDVDWFKRYNDRYGHQAGDDCLRQLATALRSTLRRSGDMLARYGGEEFVCLLPDTDLAGACTLAEQLRQVVAALRIEHVEAGAAPWITVSLGVSTRPAAMAGSVGSAADLLREADAQLYRAKSAGRNQVQGALLNEV